MIKFIKYTLVSMCIQFTILAFVLNAKVIDVVKFSGNWIIIGGNSTFFYLLMLLCFKKMEQKNFCLALMASSILSYVLFIAYHKYIRS